MNTMTKIEKEAILLGAQTVFFEAKLDGYVGGECRRSVKVITMEGDTMVTTITFNDGNYQVVDQYKTTIDSDRSDGRTVVSFKGEEVWCMFYGGRYTKELVPFLKEALGTTFQTHTFVGGRGPVLYPKDNLAYHNLFNGVFSGFHGREYVAEILSASREVQLGYHEYIGTSTI